MTRAALHRRKLPLHFRRVAYPIIFAVLAGSFLIRDGHIFGESIVGNRVYGNVSFYAFVGLFNLILAWYLSFYHRFLYGTGAGKLPGLSDFLSRFFLLLEFLWFYMATAFWLVKALGTGPSMAAVIGVCLGLLMAYASNALCFWFCGRVLPIRVSRVLRKDYFAFFTTAMVLVFALDGRGEWASHLLDRNPFIGLWFGF